VARRNNSHCTKAKIEEGFSASRLIESPFLIQVCKRTTDRRRVYASRSISIQCVWRRSISINCLNAQTLQCVWRQVRRGDSPAIELLRAFAADALRIHVTPSLRVSIHIKLLNAQPFQCVWRQVRGEAARPRRTSD
jgi:hypothetical protein